VNDRIDPGGGGLTGATGDLTPDESEGAFVPGERREVEDRDTRATVTFRQAASAPAQNGDIGDPAGEQVDRGPTELAERESGYGSVHGLAPDDPAYRMEVNPPAAPEERGVQAAEPRIGGDRRSDHEERF
jgi:hypothetical protein